MTTFVPHTCAGFHGAFQSQHGEEPSAQEIWNAAIRSYRDLQKATRRIEAPAGVPGWICSHEDYGTWFLPYDKIKEDWKRDHFDYYREEIIDPDFDTVLTWFREQCGWVEVAAWGIQLERVDAALIEGRILHEMSKDIDWVDDPFFVGEINKEKK